MFSFGIPCQTPDWLKETRVWQIQTKTKNYWNLFSTNSNGQSSVIFLGQSNEQICPVEHQEGLFLWKCLSPEWLLSILYYLLLTYYLEKITALNQVNDLIPLCSFPWSLLFLKWEFTRYACVHIYKNYHIRELQF